MTGKKYGGVSETQRSPMVNISYITGNVNLNPLVHYPVREMIILYSRYFRPLKHRGREFVTDLQLSTNLLLWTL